MECRLFFESMAVEIIQKSEVFSGRIIEERETVSRIMGKGREGKNFNNL